MNVRYVLGTLLAGLLAHPVSAAELRVYPPEVTISGPNRVQQLLVVEEQNGRVVADHTAAAKYVTSNTTVAKVDSAGLVTGDGNGEASLTATVGGQSVT